MKVALAFFGVADAIRFDREVDTALAQVYAGSDEVESMKGIQDDLKPWQMCLHYFCSDVPSEAKAECQSKHASQCGLFDICTKETVMRG